MMAINLEKLVEGGDKSPPQDTSYAPPAAPRKDESPIQRLMRRLYQTDVNDTNAVLGVIHDIEQWLLANGHQTVFDNVRRLMQTFVPDQYLARQNAVNLVLNQLLRLGVDKNK